MRTVIVNSVRWICPKCANINAAASEAVGLKFSCEKCGESYIVKMPKGKHHSDDTQRRG